MGIGLGLICLVAAQVVWLMFKSEVSFAYDAYERLLVTFGVSALAIIGVVSIALQIL